MNIFHFAATNFFVIYICLQNYHYEICLEFQNQILLKIILQMSSMIISI